MASVNKVIIIGNLCRDPEVRQAGDSTVCNLSVATNRKFKKGEELVEEVEFHRVTVWGKQAEACGRYLTKGRQAYVEGRLQTRSYEDKDGVKKFSTEIVAEVVQFLGGKDGGQRSGGDGTSRSGDDPSFKSKPGGHDDDSIPF
jgi:single-strand DNA-binding protein